VVVLELMLVQEYSMIRAADNTLTTVYHVCFAPLCDLHAQMIEFMKEGEFVRAHDIYMLTAIGNAPWPIGLTMVGIHERSGREKVNCNYFSLFHTSFF
jgi:Prp18 domain